MVPGLRGRRSPESRLVGPLGTLPGEGLEIGFDPAGPGSGVGECRGPVEASEQLLVEQCRVLVGETVEVSRVCLAHVVAYQFDPCPADGGVVFLWHAGVSGGALDT